MSNTRHKRKRKQRQAHKRKRSRHKRKRKQRQAHNRTAKKVRANPGLFLQKIEKNLKTFLVTIYSAEYDNKKNKMTTFDQFLTRNGLNKTVYQAECFAWCLAREHVESDVKGGILALEMGLGKTIIMLGLIQVNFQRGRTLIVLPKTLLTQWEQAIQKNFGHKALVYHGTHPKSLRMTQAEIEACPIVLTTYGQLAQSRPQAQPQAQQAQPQAQADQEQEQEQAQPQPQAPPRQSLLHSITWARIICDEAHNVSHHKTSVFQGIEKIRKHNSLAICWLVSGTPIQNNTRELYNLLCLLGVNPPKPSARKKVSYENKEREEKSYIYTIIDLLTKYVYQGTKASVGIVLPPVEEHTEIVAWDNTTEQQFATHIHSLLQFCNVPVQENDRIAVAILQEEDQRKIRMKYMARARQICTYPPLLKKSIERYEALQERTARQAQAQAQAQPREEDGAEPLDYSRLLYGSESKMRAVIETLVERQDNGNGKIVFCQFYQEIDAYERVLLSYGMTVAKFDGRVPHGNREAVLNEPVNVLLAQLKMCREGLNLQAHYSEVYFPSPHFNPAVEAQAIARCWRIGQTKPVQVFRYLMSHTAPEKTSEIAVPYSLDGYTEKIQQIKRGLYDQLGSMPARIGALPPHPRIEA